MYLYIKLYCVYYICIYILAAGNRPDEKNDTSPMTASCWAEMCYMKKAFYTAIIYWLKVRSPRRIIQREKRLSD